MSKLLLAGAVAMAALFSGFSTSEACPGKEKQAKAEEKAAPSLAVTTAMFKVDGMHCAGCGDHIKEALAKAGGVVKVEVKAADKKVIVTFDKDKITADKIAKLISDAGYPATTEV
jgi:copper chaperone CopZ